MAAESIQNRVLFFQSFTLAAVSKALSISIAAQPDHALDSILGQ
jgi:hypothetical protein